MSISDTLERIKGRAHREAAFWGAKTRQTVHRWHYSPNPNMSADDQTILTDLHRTGVHVTSLSRLGLQGTDSLLASSAQLATQLRTQSPDMSHSDAQSFMVLADPIELARHSPDVLLFGLQDRVLDIVEGYMQQPTHCLGVFARRDLADGASSGTRTSHKDRKDIFYVKMIVYLSEVDEDCGPFEYVPEDNTTNTHQSITGPAGTVLFVDTARLYHRGKIPSRERFALFFSYATRSPSNPRACARGHFLPGLAHLSTPLTDRQRESLPWHIIPKG